MAKSNPKHEERIMILGKVLSPFEYSQDADITDSDKQTIADNWKTDMPVEFANLLEAKNQDIT